MLKAPMLKAPALNAPALKAPVLKAIVFDLDGTLVDSAPDIAWGINRMLADRGLPPQPVALIETLTGEGASVLVAKVYDHLGVAADAERVAADTAAYLHYYRARPAQDSRLFADVADTVPALVRAGFRLGVCTNKQEALARLVLDHFDLAACFPVVVGADTTRERKPHPAPLLHALALLGAQPAESVFVGDTPIDRACAEAAGVPCRIVSWGTGGAVAVAASQRLHRLAELLPARAA